MPRMRGIRVTGLPTGGPSEDRQLRQALLKLEDQ